MGIEMTAKFEPAKCSFYGFIALALQTHVLQACASALLCGPVVSSVHKSCEKVRKARREEKKAQGRENNEGILEEQHVSCPFFVIFVEELREVYIYKLRLGRFKAKRKKNLSVPGKSKTSGTQVHIWISSWVSHCRSQKLMFQGMENAGEEAVCYSRETKFFPE